MIMAMKLGDAQDDGAVDNDDDDDHNNNKMMMTMRAMTIATTKIL